MNCRDLDSLMHSYLDEELVDGERLALESHLTGCQTCTQRTEVERHNLTLVRTRAHEGAPVAPDSLRARIHQGIHRESRKHFQRRALQVSAAAASVAILAGVGQQQWHVWQRHLFVEEAARRHSRQLPLETQGQPEVLEAWFGGKLDHRVSVPRFPNATAAGARLINVRDREAAYIRYDAPRANSAEPRHMGLFVFDDSGDLDLAALPSTELGNSHGYNVVSWREGDVVYELVTDLDETDIRALVPHQSGDARTPLPTSRPSLDVRPASMTTP
jgi:anti-sigma factor RsiW